MSQITGTEFIIYLSEWLDKEIEDVGRIIKEGNYGDTYFDATLKGKRATLKQVQDKLGEYFVPKSSHKDLESR